MHADWPAPENVKTFTTFRTGGVSHGPFASLNLATHVGDDSPSVCENRLRLSRLLALPVDPVWLNQVHGNSVINVADCAAHPIADAAIAFGPGRVCAVMTADCLPVAFATKDGDGPIAIAHAGWRGLVGGVLPNTLNRMGVPADRVIAWLGPAICSRHYEVDLSVLAAFRSAGFDIGPPWFEPSGPEHWYCDLSALADQQLRHLEVAQVFASGRCTYGDAGRFYSYRRDGKRTGRTATLIWRSG